jgi:hypothetical protein
MRRFRKEFPLFREVVFSSVICSVSHFLDGLLDFCGETLSLDDHGFMAIVTQRCLRHPGDTACNRVLDIIPGGAVSDLLEDPSTIYGSSKILYGIVSLTRKRINSK